MLCATPPSLQERSVSQCVYTGGDTCETVTVPIVWPGPGAGVSCDEGTWLPSTAVIEPPCTLLEDIDWGR